MPPRKSTAGAPKELPQGPPPSPSERDRGFDHSFTLQAVMEMKESLGKFGEKIDRLRIDVDGLGTKIDATGAKVDKINTKLVWVAGICTGITAIVLIVWTIVTQVPWDRILDRRDQGVQVVGQPVSAPKPSGSHP